MSVSDPLLKKLKGFIVDFRTNSNEVTDAHHCLQSFCDTLELILRKGLKQSNSIFGLARRDYWGWIDAVAHQTQHNTYDRINPIFSMVVDDVKACKKVTTVIGRGRLFLRLALQKKIMCVPLEHLLKNTKVLMTWYDPTTSIMGDEILSEILMSLLFEVTAANFKLVTKNCMFLDTSWEMPIYKEYEFVPCVELGLEIEHVDGMPVTISVDAHGVGFEDKKVEPGDVLDELLGKHLRDITRGKIPTILRRNQGFPIRMSVIKSRREDGSLFPPIGYLMQRIKDRGHIPSLLDLQDKAEAQRSRRLPPHAQLPEHEEEGVPVHNADDMAEYPVYLVGKTEVGTNGGVHMIEVVIQKVLDVIKPEDNPEMMRAVSLELGEKDVLVTDRKSKELVYRHSYTEISSCGRRTDTLLYFAYIAGETTCTLAKNFVAYIFKARTDEEAKTMLCSIAQGFGRTHWFV